MKTVLLDAVESKSLKASIPHFEVGDIVDVHCRIKEGDKTVMYENELSYYHLEVSLSQYLELKAVRGYGADSLIGIEIDSISFFGDSARVHSRIKFESADGSIKEQPANIRMYRDAGRWVRPYLSMWDKELDYLEQKRVYDSVTAGQ